MVGSAFFYHVGAWGLINRSKLCLVHACALYNWDICQEVMPRFPFIFGYYFITSLQII